MSRFFAPLLVVVFGSLSAQAELHWIWGPKPAKDREGVSLRTTFMVPADLASATVRFACDNGAKLVINGKPALVNPDWMIPTSGDVTKLLKPGAENALLANATNKGGSAGFALELTMKSKHGDVAVIETNEKTWQATVTGSDAWAAARSVGRYGDQPWGKAFDAKGGKGGGKRGGDGVAIDPKDVTVPAGFKVEQLYVVPKEEQGSWVALTFDPKNRLIACDQYGGLYRVTVPAIGSGGKSTVEKLPLQIEGAHGLLWAFDSLYFMKNEGAGDHGLYRITDDNKDGELETIKLLRRMNGGGEHGSHSLQLSPDGKSIFFNGGNHVDLPDGELTSRPVMGSWDEDHILPRMWDANGHARGKLAPGGWICQSDPEAKNVQVFCMGFRNEFDFAFASNGEIFAYDADMEWDIGSPWYRPTRINHCVSGADYGWRSGSGKWPTYYEDSLPEAVNIGPGSPTGVCSGVGAKFPAKYQRAIFANDWTYGTMYAIHLVPNGAGFTATKEEFCYGKPLPLTDVVISQQDGAMYFAVGGRRTQSAVYRVSYSGPLDQTDQSDPTDPAIAQRKALEAFHKVDPAAIEAAWPALGSPDRYLRYAARVAVEHQPVDSWKSKALAETDTQRSLSALIALARMGRSDVTKTLTYAPKPAPGSSSAAVPAGSAADAALQKEVLAALAKHDLAKLSRDHQLQLLRAYQLAFTRLGKPDDATAAAVVARLDPHFPHADGAVNRELCNLLIFLGAPSAPAKTLSLMATAMDDTGAIASDALLARNDGYARAANEAALSRPNARQIDFMFALRNAKAGWTPELRQTYFSWFPRARTWKGGNSFKGFIENTRKDALATFVPADEQARLDELSNKNDSVVPANITPPKGPGRAYSTDDVVKVVQGQLTKRDFASGKNLFGALMCATCHPFAGEGGSIGPDVTGAGNRYSLRDLAENLVEPSKVVSDQYGSHLIEKTDGSIVSGRIIGDSDSKVSVMTNPFAPNVLVTLDAKDIKSRKDQPISMMPPGLINSLNEEELRDLFAYLLSAGNAGDKMFAK